MEVTGRCDGRGWLGIERSQSDQTHVESCSRRVAVVVVAVFVFFVYRTAATDKYANGEREAKAAERDKHTNTLTHSLSLSLTVCVCVYFVSASCQAPFQRAVSSIEMLPRVVSSKLRVAPNATAGPTHTAGRPVDSSCPAPACHPPASLCSFRRLYRLFLLSRQRGTHTHFSPHWHPRFLRLLRGKERGGTAHASRFSQLSCVAAATAAAAAPLHPPIQTRVSVQCWGAASGSDSVRL